MKYILVTLNVKEKYDETTINHRINTTVKLRTKAVTWLYTNGNCLIPNSTGSKGFSCANLRKCYKNEPMLKGSNLTPLNL